jgi:hypothetical protein
MQAFILDGEGRAYPPDHPDYDKVRINNLESHVRELQVAIIDLQNRVSRLDREPLQWPGDTYGPTFTEPYNR